MTRQTYTVTMRFQFPAWDEKNGIAFHNIDATSKSDAIKLARRIAEHDGHGGTGKGRATFTALKEVGA